MFTKIKIQLLLILAGFVVFPQVVSASSLEPLTSGLKYSYYKVEWCPTDTNISTGCVDAFFTKDGSTGILSYTGGFNYQSNDATKVKLNPNFTSTKTTSKSLIDIFQGISNIKFQGEGKYTFKIVLVDFANNASVQDLVYLVDKTAPQFEILSTTDGSNFVYSGERVDGVFQNVIKYDSNTQISNSDDRFDTPISSSYSGDVAQLRDTHVRSKLHTIYFRDLDVNHKFTMNLKYSENYDNALNNYSAGLKDFSLLDDSNTILANGLTLGTSVELNTSYFSAISPDSQKKYKLRIYDKAVGKGGINDSNYSEVAFYAVRDNTAPNLLKSTKTDPIAQRDAMKKLLQFGDNTPVWDETTSGFDIKTAGKSFARFIAANDTFTLKSVIEDVGIGAVNAERYNAGVATGVAIRVDTAANNLVKSDVISYTNRFNNDVTITNDFSLVDNYIDSSKGYRYYDTEFKNVSTLDGICDLVGNCLKPELQFRVVADEMNNVKSQSTLAASSTKAIGDGTTPYTFTTQIKDEYGNVVRSIQSAENSGLTLKTLSSEFEFKNDVYLDQVNKTGDKGLVVVDNETDNLSNNLSGINLANKINFTEDFAQNGKFSFKFGSLAPTSGAYPYTSGIEASIKNINTKVELGAGISSIVFGNVGAFNNLTNLGSTELITINKSLFVNEKTKDIDSTKKINYGDVSVTDPNNNFAALSAKKVNFEFTPAFLYTTDLDLSPLYAFNSYDEHNKKIEPITSEFVFDGSMTESFLSSYDSSNKDNPLAIKFSYSGSTTTDARGKVFSSPISGKYSLKATPLKSSYDPNKKIVFGYSSKLLYKVNGEDVILPSISRNVSKNITDIVVNKGSQYFYSDDYVVIDDGKSVGGVVGGLGIAVTGLTNKNNTLLDGNFTGQKANVNIGGELTRYELIKTIKSNIAKNSKGVIWCTGDKYITDSTLSSCTQIFGTEKVVFIKGNLIIDSDRTDTSITTYVVEDGYIYINGNISNKNIGKLTFVTTTSQGLKDISLSNLNNFDMSSGKAWIFINPKVTNIDASLIAEGAVVSYDDNVKKLYGADITSNELRNQLHIYGSVLSLNTIGGTKENDALSKCPYIVSNCTRDTAAVFDLVNLRRFTLLNDGTQVYAYYPDDANKAKRSGGKSGLFTLGDITKIGDLRSITDSDYQIYPLFIEKDPKISTSPSVIFRTDR